MELLISDIVARNLYCDVNDAVQKAFTVLIRGNEQDEVDYKGHAPQEKRFLKVVTSKTVFAWPLAQTTFKKSLTIYLE